VALLKRSRFLSLAAGILVVRSLGLSANPITEPQAKASLLYNLPAFVEWPSATLGIGDRLSICVAGDPDVLVALKSYEGRAIVGHAVTSRAVVDDGDPTTCHILFVSGAREPALALVRRAADSPVLTVGDGLQFTRQGGALRVFFEQSRIRFEINTTIVARTRLKLSSKMLGLARIVRSGQ
jgi:hypothetical protein